MKTKIDLDWLLRVRVVIARCGEMDASKWWNTKGQLGPYGAKALGRGFPRTHYFAQTRSVIAVADHRCKQVFNPPNCATLWHLTDTFEDEFDAQWERWLDNARDWAPFFEAVAGITNFDVPQLLQKFDLVTISEFEQMHALKRSVEAKAVHIPGFFSEERRNVALLALAFGKASHGDLLVPYIRLTAP